MNKSAPSKHFLRDQISSALHEYFAHLDGTKAKNIYHLVLSEMEAPLLEIVLQYTEGNQSRAAECLGLSRGTLKKLLLKYKILGKSL
jgi:Fis family transcriptional regulator, factor for inversion stimulation protein